MTSATVLFFSNLPTSHVLHELSLASSKMTTSSLPPSADENSHRSAPEAINKLLASGLKKDDIVALKQFGPDGLARLLDIVQHEGRSGVSALVESLESMTEVSINHFIVMSNAFLRKSSLPLRAASA